MTAVFTITTGTKLQSEAKPLWQRWRNQVIHERNTRDIPAQRGLIRWNLGFCWDCMRVVDPYATGCKFCHVSFVE